MFAALPVEGSRACVYSAFSRTEKRQLLITELQPRRSRFSQGERSEFAAAISPPDGGVSGGHWHHENAEEKTATSALAPQESRARFSLLSHRNDRLLWTDRQAGHQSRRQHYPHRESRTGSSGALVLR